MSNKIGRNQTIGAMKVVTKIEDIFSSDENDEIGKKKMSKKINTVLSTVKQHEVLEAYEILSQMYFIVSHEHYATLTLCVSNAGANTLRGLSLADSTAKNHKKNEKVFVIEKDDYTVTDDDDDEDVVKAKTVLINTEKTPPVKEKIATRIGNAVEKKSWIFQTNRIELGIKFRRKLGFCC